MSYQLETQRLNNAAVVLLTEGRYMEAIASLTKCMLAMKTKMKYQLANSRNKSNMMAIATEECICHGHFSYRRVEFRSAAGAPTIAPATTSTPGSFVFFNPLEVTHAEYDRDCLHCEQSLLLVILFNLALSHHLNASTVIDSPPSRKESLEKAIRLYELAHYMANSESSDSCREAIVILNNLSLIHKEIGNHEYALQCQQQLLSTMMFLVDSGEDELLQELQGVLDNVIPLILSSHCPMAPAA